MQHPPPTFATPGWGNFLLQAYHIFLICTSQAPVLRNPKYRWFQTLQAISFMGSWVQIPAVGLLIYQQTGKAGAVSTLLLVSFLPSSIIAPIGGWLADHMRAQRLFLAAQVALLFQTLLLLLAQVRGQLHEMELYVLLGLASVIYGLNTPAGVKFMRELVGKGHVQQAQKINATTYNVAWAFGLPLAGIILAYGAKGATLLFAGNAVSYVGVIIFLAWHKQSPHPEQQSSHPQPQQKEKKRLGGLQYIARTPLVAIPLLFSVAINLVTESDRVVLPVIGTAANGSTHDYTMLGWGNCIGCLLGSAIMFRLKPSIGLLLGLTPLTIISFMGLGLASSLWWEMVSFFFMVGLREAITISAITQILHETDSRWLGRVNGLKQMFEQWAVLAAVLLAGYITIPAFGVRASVVGSSILGLALLSLCAPLALLLRRKRRQP